MFKDFYFIHDLLLDNYSTYNINDNPKTNILISENTRQKKNKNLGILRYIYLPSLST